MAGVTSLATLKTRLLTWLWNRADVVDELDTFIQLAEAEMNRRLTTRLKTSFDTITLSDEFTDQPDNFAGVISFKLVDSPYTELTFTTPDGITLQSAGLASSESASNTGSPRFYAIVNDQFQFFPIPGGDYEAIIVYRERIPALSTSNTTNWILDRHPDAYLYGALMQGALWLKNQEDIAAYTALFVAAMNDIQKSDVPETNAPKMRMNASTGAVI